MADMRDEDASGFHPPNADAVYARYLETCKCLGVEPVPRERARKLITEWTDTLAAGRSIPPTTH